MVSLLFNGAKEVRLIAIAPPVESERLVDGIFSNVRSELCLHIDFRSQRLVDVASRLCGHQ